MIIMIIIIHFLFICTALGNTRRSLSLSWKYERKMFAYVLIKVVSSVVVRGNHVNAGS